ncbi:MULTISPECIES: DUF4826 family protein [Pseudoalteromonas]|uniref:DUF4826 family protein n=1 Tax=Pseudoalteromonas TaxID=53246 RepID=UPI000FFEC641|nr:MULTISPECIES: DUF4826 family protein [Pseudoalteromonas]MCG9758130.1 DUF4826 family protein [Pseudoalteromonas sp. Isolate6]NKC18806.1 DUF4826 family protein [Pseudoalteromonas galatheae]RXE87865.1 DUF4826 domain-containing protein [Pseudoalteromonas sp. A757]
MSEEQNRPQQEALTPEQQHQRSIQWQRSCVQAAQKHLADKGVLPQSILEKECRYIEPMVALWKIKGQNGKKYWVITGNLPTDHIEASAAATPREALRYFSFHWQMKAEEIISAKPVDKTQAQFANLLVNRAHGLYELFSKDELWANEAS